MDSARIIPNSSRFERIDWRRVLLGCFALAALWYAVALATHMGADAGGSDSSGYLNSARLLRQGRLHIEQRSLPGAPATAAMPYAYVPLGFVPAPHHAMVPTYPPGFSLLVAGASAVTGWSLAPHLIMWLHAIAGLALMFALVRMAGLSALSAAFGAAVLGLSPLYVMMSLTAMSDVPALVWCTAAAICAWRSERDDRWSLAAGLAVGLAVLIRPMDLLIMVPVAILLGRRWQRWGWLALGGLPAAIFQLILNRELYGSALQSGYGAVGGLFGWGNVPAALANYATTLPMILTPAVGLALALPWVARTAGRRIAGALVVWFAVFAIPYAFYFHTHEAWWYLRFLMPALPPLILGMLLVARALGARWRPSVLRLAVIAAAVGLAVWDHHGNARHYTLQNGREEAAYHEAAVWAETHLPPDAVVACMQVSGAFYYYTDFVLLRWDALAPDRFAAIASVARRQHRPVYAALFSFETEDALQKHMPGRWTRIGSVRKTTFWRRDD